MGVNNMTDLKKLIKEAVEEYFINQQQGMRVPKSDFEYEELMKVIMKFIEENKKLVK